MLGERSGIHLKRQAYHNEIRKQHHSAFFSHLRQQLVHHITQNPPHPAHDTAQDLLQQLPQSAFALLDLLNEQLKAVAPYLTERMRRITQTMVDLNIPQWSALTTVISKLLGVARSREQVETVVSLTLTPVCDGALLLLDKTASRILQTELMEVGLSYCFRLGNSLKRTNHLEMHSLQLLVKALWNFSWEDEDHEQQMVLAVYNILSTRFEPEEEENVEPTAFRDLEIMKESFIRRVFYEGDMREVAKLVRRTVELAQSQGQEEELLDGYLRLLITMTLHLNQASGYYPLLGNNLLMAIDSVFLLADPSTSLLTLILTTRLFNNLLVNDYLLTIQIARQSSHIFKKMVNLSMHMPQPQLKTQITELFINLIHYMNDDGEFVRELMEFGVAQLVVEGLVQEEPGEEGVLQLVTGLTIMKEHNVIGIRRVLAGEQNRLKRVGEKYPFCGEAVAELVRSVFPPENISMEECV